MSESARAWLKPTAREAIEEFNALKKRGKVWAMSEGERMTGIDYEQMLFDGHIKDFVMQPWEDSMTPEEQALRLHDCGRQCDVKWASAEIDRLRDELAAAEDFKARCECAELACANSILHDQLAAKDKELAELREELLK